jgi:acyl-CoA synthetase (AMP-forming)/AMP-acid ligase II
VNLATVLLGTEPSARPALIAPDGTTVATAADIADQARRAAASIAASTAPGDRVAIVVPNRTEFVVAYLATLLAGRIAVPVDPTAPAAEHERHLTTVAPSLVVATEDVARLVAGGSDAAGAATTPVSSLHPQPPTRSPCACSPRVPPAHPAPPD